MFHHSRRIGEYKYPISEKTVHFFQASVLHSFIDEWHGNEENVRDQQETLMSAFNSNTYYKSDY